VHVLCVLLTTQGFSNVTEANQVVKCAVKLAQQHPVGTTVKIITYYSQQRTVLQELLERRRANTTVKNGHSPLNCIDVCSIDACQVIQHCPTECNAVAC
jgi:AAA domain